MGVAVHESSSRAVSDTLLGLVVLSSQLIFVLITEKLRQSEILRSGLNCRYESLCTRREDTDESAGGEHMIGGHWNTDSSIVRGSHILRGQQSNVTRANNLSDNSDRHTTHRAGLILFEVGALSRQMHRDEE
ncbi:hypothetical protein Tco_1316864 [Tanacetum coccineum]